MSDSSLLELFGKPVPREQWSPAEAWSWAMLLLLPFALYFVYRDLALYLQHAPLDRLTFRPDALAWGVFGAVQAAGRLPLLFDRRPRGALAAFSRFGFGLGLGASACVALSTTPGPALGWGIGFAASLVWLACEAYIAAFVPRTPGASAGRRLYCAFAGGLIPNAPFCFALYLLAGAG